MFLSRDEGRHSFLSESPIRESGTAEPNVFYSTNTVVHALHISQPSGSSPMGRKSPSTSTSSLSSDAENQFLLHFCYSLSPSHSRICFFFFGLAHVTRSVSAGHSRETALKPMSVTTITNG